MKKTFWVFVALALLTVGLLIGSFTNGLATANEGYGAGIDNRNIKWDSAEHKGGVEVVTEFGTMEIEFSRNVGDTDWIAEFRLVGSGIENEVSPVAVEFEFDESGHEGTLEVQIGNIVGCGGVNLLLESTGEYSVVFKRDFDEDGELVEIAKDIVLNVSVENGVLCDLNLDDAIVIEVEGWIELDFTKEFED